MALHVEGLLDQYSYLGAFLRCDFAGLLQPGDETGLYVALDTGIRINAALADEVTPEESPLHVPPGQHRSIESPQHRRIASPAAHAGPSSSKGRKLVALGMVVTPIRDMEFSS